MSEEKNKPAFDEQALAKLLEAAYVLQQHSRQSPPSNPPDPAPDQPHQQASPEEQGLAVSSLPTGGVASIESDLPLAQIVATQHQIQVEHLEIDKALALVAERIVEIGHGVGAAIGLVNGQTLRYRAVAGQQTPARGAETHQDKALCIPCIRTGEVFRCAEVTPKTLVDTEECRRRGIQSLVAVPIFHNGSTVGGLELYYSQPRGFSEQDVASCQLMAGLVTEALGQQDEVAWKNSLAGERTRMLEALEKLQPNLSALVDKPENTTAQPLSAHCAKCGHELVGEEQFCGRCGTARPKADQPSGTVIEASAAQPAAKAREIHTLEAPNDHLTVEEREDIDHILSGTTLEELAKSLEDDMPEVYADSDLEIHGKESSEADAKQLSLDLSEKDLSEKELLSALSPSKADREVSAQGVVEGEEIEEHPGKATLTKPAPAADWSSAHSAREFFEQLAGTSRSGGLARFWNERRGDIYLAIAVLLVAGVVRWGVWSSPSVNAKAAPNSAATHHNPGDSELSFFDRMLISLGLAEAPEPAEDKGNPSTQVWVDTHTGQYYCPGADLYGKTPTGKYASQRDAQLDQFEPAYRKTCK